MQTALILLSSALAVASASIVSFVPLTYVAHPAVPTYNHVQNTLTGEYAYNYAGGPSSKEEIKTLDGVTRGAYNYIDSYGIVQSAQYVADANGFRIAATNIPTDAQIGVNVPQETPEVQAAKVAHFAEHAKAIAALGRRKRSLDHIVASQATAVSNQYHHQEHESVKLETPVYQKYVSAFPVQTYASYEHVPVAVSAAPTAVSHQSRVQTHSGARLEISAPVSYAAKFVTPVVGAEVVRAAVPDQIISYHEAVEVPAVHVSQVVLPSVATAVSRQSRYQVHNNQKVEIQGPIYESVALPVAPIAPVAPAAAPDADSVVVDAFRTSAAVPVATVAAVASVPTAVSSQSRTQVHSGQHLEVQTHPEHVAQFVDSYGYPASAISYQSSSHAQVHSDQSQKIPDTVYGPSHLVSQLPVDTPEVAAAKHAHAKAYAAELAKHQGW